MYAGKTFGTSKANCERLHSAQLCRVFKLHAMHQYLIWLELCQKHHWKATDNALFFIILHKKNFIMRTNICKKAYRNISVLGNPKQMYLLFSSTPAISSAFFRLFLWVFVLLFFNYCNLLGRSKGGVVYQELASFVLYKALI